MSPIQWFQILRVVLYVGRKLHKHGAKGAVDEIKEDLLAVVADDLRDDVRSPCTEDDRNHIINRVKEIKARRK